MNTFLQSNQTSRGLADCGI